MRPKEILEYTDYEICANLFWKACAYFLTSPEFAKLDLVERNLFIDFYYNMDKWLCKKHMKEEDKINKTIQKCRKEQQATT